MAAGDGTTGWRAAVGPDVALAPSPSAPGPPHRRSSRSRRPLPAHTDGSSGSGSDDGGEDGGGSDGGGSDGGGDRVSRWRHLPALLVSIGCLAPFAFVLSGSLREPGPPPREPQLLPWPLSFANYPEAWDLVGLPRQVVNSLVVAAVAVPVSILVASAAGFGLARLPRTARRAMVGVTIAAAMVPTTALVVGRFRLYGALGITDTLLPLMAPGLIGESPFHVLFYFWAFRRLPADTFDAARLEGLSEVGVWWRVGLPLVRPITLAVAVSTFVDLWGSYLEPLVYVSDPDLATVPIGLGLLASLDPSNQPLLLAGAVTAAAPVVGLFLLVQRQLFRRGYP